MPQQSDEAEIHAVIHAWTQGIAAKNSATVLAQLASEVVQFDLAPPLRVNDVTPKVSNSGSRRGETRSVTSFPTYP